MVGLRINPCNVPLLHDRLGSDGYTHQEPYDFPERLYLPRIYPHDVGGRLHRSDVLGIGVDVKLAGLRFQYPERFPDQGGFRLWFPTFRSLDRFEDVFRGRDEFLLIIVASHWASLHSRLWILFRGSLWD